MVEILSHMPEPISYAMKKRVYAFDQTQTNHGTHWSDVEQSLGTQYGVISELRMQA